MDIDFQALVAWVYAHPELLTTVALVLLYWARAAMPRKPPSSPFWFAVWELETKVLAMPWDRWLGRPHFPGKVVPELLMWKSEQPTKSDRPLPRKEGAK